LPTKQNVIIFFLFAALRALTILVLFPEVVIPTAMSPELPIASICLEKIFSNLKSLPMAVIAEVSVVIEIAGRALLFFLNFTIISVARCCACAALPPFPKKIIFFFFWIAKIDFLINI